MSLCYLAKDHVQIYVFFKWQFVVALYHTASGSTRTLPNLLHFLGQTSQAPAVLLRVTYCDCSPDEWMVVC